MARVCINVLECMLHLWQTERKGGAHDTSVMLFCVHGGMCSTFQDGPGPLQIRPLIGLQRFRGRCQSV
eukprot:6000686-Pleurochrysis_carterae.AAC.1